MKFKASTTNAYFGSNSAKDFSEFRSGGIENSFPFYWLIDQFISFKCISLIKI